MVVISLWIVCRPVYFLEERQTRPFGALMERIVYNHVNDNVMLCE